MTENPTHWGSVSIPIQPDLAISVRNVSTRRVYPLQCPAAAIIGICPAPPSDRLAGWLSSYPKP
jgi:hypothetical protein